MRILCLANDAFGGRGGIAQACRDVLTAMAHLDCVDSIDVLPRHLDSTPRGLPPKICQHVPKPSRAAFSAAAFSAVRKSPDVVFCSHLFLSPVAATVAALSGAALIIHLHGIEIWHAPTYLQRLAMEMSDALWCVSRDTRARALGYASFPPERAIVLNNGVRSEFIPGDRAAARARFGLGEEFVLLTVGRLDMRERYKGHDRVIAALPQLKAGGRRMLYLIVGDGDDRFRLARLARAYDVQEEVRLLGGIDSEMLPDVYRAADLFVLPSTGEGFGIAFLEAMACGTPAIGLAVGGAIDPLADGELGTCVSEAEFATALSDAVRTKRPDAAQLSAEVHRRFGRERFTADVAHALSWMRTRMSA